MVVKFTSRITSEAHERLKIECIKLGITIEKGLNFLIINGHYPTVEDCRKFKEEKD